MGIPLDKAELLAIFLETFFFGACLYGFILLLFAFQPSRSAAAFLLLCLASSIPTCLINTQLTLRIINHHRNLRNPLLRYCARPATAWTGRA